MTESCIACSKVHFRKGLSYIETSWLTDSVNHLTGFYLILPFTEKNMSEYMFKNDFNPLYSTKFVIFVKFNPVPILFHHLSKQLQKQPLSMKIYLK